MEGTVLTVIRDRAHSVRQMCHTASGFSQLFHRTIAPDYSLACHSRVYTTLVALHFLFV